MHKKEIQKILQIHKEKSSILLSPIIPCHSGHLHRNHHSEQFLISIPEKYV
jgi:hypothetical protein